MLKTVFRLKNFAVVNRLNGDFNDINNIMLTIYEYFNNKKWIFTC